MKEKNEESLVLEYKVELPKRNKTWLKSIVSFSNTSGGKLIVGVEDETLKIIGLNEEKEILKERMIDLIDTHIFPTPEYEVYSGDAKGKELLIIKVAKGIAPPYRYKDEDEDLVYVRYGDTDQIASEIEINELYMRADGETFTSLIYHDPKHRLKVVSDDGIERFLELINKDAKVKANIKDLISWNVLINKDEVYYATNGYMLMSDNPFENRFIRISVYEGKNRAQLLREINTRGSIIHQYNEAKRILLSLLVTKKETYVPLEVISELLANATVHRQYMEDKPIGVEIYSDHMLIYSPGPLINGLTINDMVSGISKLRNKNIGEVFYHMGIIGRWGKGYDRINTALENNGQENAKINVGSKHGVAITIYFKES